jgi:hypothetical protein
MEISNKTNRPLRVPLPGGKKLHLSPGKTGQIAPKAADHPALKKLIDEGQIEIVDVERAQASGANGGTGGVGPSRRRASGGVARHSGDR